MYLFSMGYDDAVNEAVILPLPPESFKTTVNSRNKTFDLIGMGEINTLKGIGLREFEFKILLPKDSSLCDYKKYYNKPIVYLNKFREFKKNKKPVRFSIIRTLPDGEELFYGNLLVSLEDYNVEENAGEEGEFWVELKLKEYVKIEISVYNEVPISEATENEKKQVTEEKQRAVKETAETYVVQQGDSLWKIAKLQLNDGSRYKEIAEVNGIENYNAISAGMELKIP